MKVHQGFVASYWIIAIAICLDKDLVDIVNCGSLAVLFFVCAFES